MDSSMSWGDSSVEDFSISNAQATPITFKKGDRVRIFGLTGKIENNGRTGIVEFDILKKGANNGRYQVLLLQTDKMEQYTAAYKPENMSLLQDEDQEDQEDQEDYQEDEEACTCNCCFNHEETVFELSRDIYDLQTENHQLQEEKRHFQEENRELKLKDAESSLFPLLNKQRNEIIEKDLRIAQLMKELEALKASSLKSC